LDTLRQEIAALESKNGNASQSLANTKREIDTFVTANTDMIRKGLPFRKKERLATLPANLQEPAAPVADTLAAIWNFAQQELRTGSSAQTFTEMVNLENGRSLHARLIQAGHQFLAFITEDGQFVGTWPMNSDVPQWHITTDKSQIQTIRRVIEIIDQQAPPGLEQLPLEISFTAPHHDGKEVVK